MVWPFSKDKNIESKSSNSDKVTFKIFEEDTEKHEAGSPMYIFKNPEAFVSVRRIGGVKYEQETKNIRKMLYGFDQDKADGNEVMAHWLAEYGVTDWDGIQCFDTGIDLPFSRKEARKIFTNKAYWLSLNQRLISKAMDANSFLTEDALLALEDLKKL